MVGLLAREVIDRGIFKGQGLRVFAAVGVQITFCRGDDQGAVGEARGNDLGPAASQIISIAAIVPVSDGNPSGRGIFLNQWSDGVPHAAMPPMID